MAKTHTIAQYAAHEAVAFNFVKCVNAYNDIMAHITAAKQDVLNANTWATDAEFVADVGAVITDPSNDFMLADFDAYVLACEAEYPKHGVIVTESGLVPEHAAYDAMTKARTALIKVVCEITGVESSGVLNASIVKQNEFASLACEAVGIKIKL